MSVTILEMRAISPPYCYGVGVVGAAPGVSVMSTAVPVGALASGVFVAPDALFTGQACSSTRSWVQLPLSVQMFKLMEVFSCPRQITTWRPLNLSTVLQPVSRPTVDREAVSATAPNVTVSGRMSSACAIPSIQYWHASKIKSPPVTGTTGVPVAFGFSVAMVSVVAVPAVTVISAKGEASRPIGPLVAIVVGVASAQAALSNTSV